MLELQCGLGRRFERSQKVKGRKRAGEVRKGRLKKEKSGERRPAFKGREKET